jgi:beta-lactamase superfamily II metal-dependent hydrolase
MRMLRLALLFFLSFLIFGTVTSSQLFSAPPRALEIYVIDVEGGQATLFVAPSGQSLLIDTGWPDFDGRDAGRIVHAAKIAGLSRIDYVLITHYHRDHVGGVPQLAQRIKIGAYVDHGPNLEEIDDPRQNYAAYEKAIAGTRRILAKPGDKIPLAGVDIEILTAAGERIRKPLVPNPADNPLCIRTPAPNADPSENARSLGVLLTYGKLRVLDLGDLTKKKEMELVCPKNLIGAVDLFIVSHHGSEESNTKSLVHAIHPRVSIMDNGAKKGGSPSAWTIVHASPELEDLWQSHYAVAGGKDHNVAPDFIVNPEGPAGTGEDKGNFIHVIAGSDGSMTVTNERNGFKKNYGIRSPALTGSVH